MSQHLKAEFEHLVRLYGRPDLFNVILPTGQFEPMQREERDGEVVIAILRPNHKLITITKPFYPEGTYRLPSGGIEMGESVEAALHREIYEETNLTVEIVKYISIINYIVITSKRKFTSHVFLVKEIGGELECIDREERISNYKDIDFEDLYEIIGHLEKLGGEFSEWGIFRAAPHKAVLKALRNFHR